MEEETITIITIDIGNDTTKFHCNKNIKEKLPNPIKTNTKDSKVLEKSEIINYDNYEKLCYKIFYENLKIIPEESPVYFTLNTTTTNSQKMKMTQIGFETFAHPAAYFCDTNVELLYVTGRTTGLILDSGDGITTITSFLEGQSQFSIDSNSTPISGSFITNYLMESYKNDNLSLENAKYLKENYCDFSIDFVKDFKNFKENQLIELPDGTKLKLKEEILLAPEILFNCSIVDSKKPGFQDLILDQIELHSIESRRFLLENIIVTGGNCNFKGFKGKLENEICSIIKPEIVETKDKIMSKLIGSIIHSNMNIFQQLWISKDEYDEVGPNICRRSRKIF